MSRYSPTRECKAATALLGILFLLCLQPAVGQQLTYLILPDTSEPAMITEPGDPMSGGMFTDIVKAVFEGTRYDIVPLVVPWERMRIEFQERDDWINLAGVAGVSDRGSQSAVHGATGPDERGAAIL